MHVLAHYGWASMTNKYHGERKAIQHGGSTRLTIPPKAVEQLGIGAGDFIAVYGSNGVLMLVPSNDDHGGGSDEEHLP